VFDYQVLRVIWWLILGVLLIGFAITDGFDMGVAAVFRFVGRSDEERRSLLESVEPVWEGNQVWFILGGGAVFAAWPLLYAASFSNLYLAMLLVLLTFILRPVGFTFRNKIADPRWRGLWDWTLTIAGLVAPLLFGVAFGNLFLGIPFHFDALMRPMYTGGFFNLLAPFALLVGVVSLTMLVQHGATYAALKADQSLSARAAAVGGYAAIAFLVTFVLAGVWVAYGLAGHHIVSGADPLGPSNPMLKSVTVTPGAWLANFHAHPVLWAVPLLASVASLATFALLRAGRPGIAFVTSSVTLAGTILTGGIGLFPFLMPSSTNPDQGLTVWDASSSAKTLGLMLGCVILFLPIVLAYTTWVYRVLKGRVTLDYIRHHSSLY
jgi:cytochrome bd ubiquinol oxidase subunit II